MFSTTEDLRRFWSELACLLEDGWQLLDALRTAQRECASSEASRAVAQVADMVADHASLSDALAAQPEFFGLGAVCVIRGGEHLGMVARAARFVSQGSRECPSCAAWRGSGVP